MTFIKNKILNKTGLATSIWNDQEPDKLRKRLLTKVKSQRLKPVEKEAILNAIKKLLNDAKKELS